MRVPAGRLMVTALAIGLAACTTSVTPASSPAWPPVRVYNATSIPVALVVNGSAVAVIPAEGLADPVASPFPDRPWVIELRSPSGGVLLAVDVPSGPITGGIWPIAALQCGRIEVAIAGQLPISEPAYSAAAGPSPCD
jgi:hypothetical protein